MVSQSLHQAWAPFFQAGVGFEGLLDNFQAAHDTLEKRGPAYNIVKVAENRWTIELAVVGFTLKELQVELQDGQLLISGSSTTSRQEDSSYLHRGVWLHDFSRRFNLAENIHVVGADLENGLLSVQLEREIPEALKPRRIEIAASEKKHKKAA